MNTMMQAALDLAAEGRYVFPVHEPIFKDKVCIGCTCESYKRSAKYKAYLEEQGRGNLFDPKYTCKNQGKCPRVKWGEKSTIDAATIRQWWHWWPTSNIGVDVGKSGLLILDADKYKPEYEEIDMPLADRRTRTSLTGGNGEQLWYEMGDKRYTNSPKGLPPCNDIRGIGGYIVAPPSLHKSGRRYTFEEGYGIGEVDILPIPSALESILNASNRTMRQPGAQVVPSAIDVTRAQRLAERVFDSLGVTHYGAQAWNDGVKFILATCPFNPDDNPHGEDRSAFVTIAADGALSAGCHHNRCQHVIADSKLSGWHLLKQLAGIAPAEAKAPNAFDNLLAQAKEFVKTTNFAPFIRAELQSAKGYLSMETDRAVASALLDLAARAGNFTVYAAYETLRDLAGLGSKSTIKLSLERLSGWYITRNQTAPARDMACTYSINIQWIVEFVLRRSNASNNNKDLCVRSTQYENRKATDPFLSGRSRTAKREGLTEAGVGKELLLLMDLLSDGQGWEKLEMAEETEKKAGGLGRLLKRGEALGLLYSERETPRSPKIYYLSPDAWDKIAALTPSLKTFKLRAERKERALEQEQDRVEIRGKMATLPKTIEHYAARGAAIILARRRYLAMIHPDWTEEMIDAWVKTAKPTATPRLDAMDKKLQAEARNMAKQNIVGPQAEQYAALAGYNKHEARRLGELTVAYQQAGGKHGTRHPQTASSH